MGFGMIFAVFQGEVVVERSTSIDFDPQITQISPVPSAGAKGHRRTRRHLRQAGKTRITLRVIRSGNIRNSLKLQLVMT